MKQVPPSRVGNNDARQPSGTLPYRLLSAAEARRARRIAYRAALEVLG